MSAPAGVSSITRLLVEACSCDKSISDEAEAAAVDSSSPCMKSDHSLGFASKRSEIPR